LNTETEKIAEVTGKPIEAFATRIERHAPYVYEMRKTVAEGKCVFLHNNRCTIYPLRPLVCKFYPFELKPVKNGKHQFLCTQECQGIGKGEKLPRNYFQKLFQQLPVC
jgi:Fe-S-cluster containining protein